MYEGKSTWATRSTSSENDDFDDYTPICFSYDGVCYGDVGYMFKTPVGVRSAVWITLK